MPTIELLGVLRVWKAVHLFCLTTFSTQLVRQLNICLPIELSAAQRKMRSCVLFTPKIHFQHEFIRYSPLFITNSPIFAILEDFSTLSTTFHQFFTALQHFSPYVDLFSPLFTTFLTPPDFACARNSRLRIQKLMKYTKRRRRNQL